MTDNSRQQQHQHILIIGAGLGGLVLAMGLKRAGIPFTIFERDTSATERNQGYYNRYSQFGLTALKNLLPISILQEMEANSDPLTNNTPDIPFFYRFISTDGETDIIVPLPPAPSPLVRSCRDLWIFIRRDVFRRILVKELADHIRWDHKFVDYDDDECKGVVTAIFTNGARVTGRLIVGADGSNSRVANARGIPPPYLCKTEVISGQVRKTSPEMHTTPDPRQMNALSFTTDYTTDGPMPRWGDTVLQMVQSDMSPITSWFVAAMKGFDQGDDGNDIGTLSKPELAAKVRASLRGFAPSLILPVAETHNEELFAWKLRVRAKVPQWRTHPRVTFLGDAVHSMSFGGGLGANMTFVSADMLCRALIGNVERIGEEVELIKGYEDEMREIADVVLDGVKEMSVAMFGMDYE